jgi:large subunit ribosomal protein L29
MKTKQLKQMETEHLHHELAEKQKHLFDLRTQAITEKLEDPSQLMKTRRDIARVKTILRQRDIETAKTASKK